MGRKTASDSKTNRVEQMLRKYIQQTFSGSHTDGSVTTAISNSFLRLLEKSHGCRFRIIQGDFLFSYIENGILCVLIRIASTRRF